MVIKLETHKFEEQFSNMQRPMLFGYFCRDHELKSHIQVLEDVQTFFEHRLDVFFMEACSFRAFGHYHRIAGTPTFLAFNHGREHGRFLGKATLEVMIAFVKRTLPLDAQAMAAATACRCSHV